jgi:hypothetical protein
MDVDSLHDGGIIEISHDNGISWKNLLEDTISQSGELSGKMYTLADSINSAQKPGFNHSFDWETTTLFVVSFMSEYSDTTTFRFTFFSDSIDNQKDGWMIGSISIIGQFEELPENIYSKMLLYPNPADEFVQLKYSNLYEQNEFQIFDSQGILVTNVTIDKSQKIATSYLENGVYWLVNLNENQQIVNKLVIQH